MTQFRLFMHEAIEVTERFKYLDILVDLARKPLKKSAWLCYELAQYGYLALSMSIQADKDSNVNRLCSLSYHIATRPGH